MGDVCCFQLLVIQHVDVCMFSNGKFKNVVGAIDSEDECPLRPGASLDKTYKLNPTKGVPKNWIALEDGCAGSSPSSSLLAPSVTCNTPEERNVFAIYVSYYVKVKLLVGTIGGKISLKLPFTLTPSSTSLLLSSCEEIKNESTSDQYYGHQVVESCCLMTTTITTTNTTTTTTTSTATTTSEVGINDQDDGQTKNKNEYSAIRVGGIGDIPTETEDMGVI